MKAVIVNAGLGTRLYPITKCISKGLVPVYDKPALMYQLTFLADMKIKDAAIVVSKKHYDAYKNFLDEIDTNGLNISLYTQKCGTGVVAAYESCSEFTQGSDIILIMGDCLYFTDDVTKLIEQAENCFCSDKVGVVVGKTRFNSGNTFMNQIQDLESLSADANLEESKELSAVGMYFLPKSLSGSLDGFINVEFKDSDMDYIYEKLLHTKRILFPQLGLNDEWFDIGTPERLFIASSYVREKKD